MPERIDTLVVLAFFIIILATWIYFGILSTKLRELKRQKDPNFGWGGRIITAYIALFQIKPWNKKTRLLKRRIWISAIIVHSLVLLVFLYIKFLG